MECGELLVTVSFCSRASRLRLLRSVMRDTADLAGLDESQTEAMVLAVNEACMNIIQHAYGMNPDGQIDVSVLQEQDALVMRVRDYADAIDVEQVRSRELDDIRPGGLGVYLINSLMDECGFLEPPRGGGNVFQMKLFTREQGEGNDISG
ncbi:serine/threonine-protein kinase RsbW [Thiogranum longum]|uniref:Serine/threonine-protein kinase RsbW n=1 Tax=Thiogranum longum TaxID=1537524 RepID=A0A4R1HC25_9GAMM|nr:ATP-binding protein [Thiogranum longum]TCK18978.1 serine/threonine-protein kinase RsbW [Thiogranum longum]